VSGPYQTTSLSDRSTPLSRYPSRKGGGGRRGESWRRTNPNIPPRRFLALKGGKRGKKKRREKASALVVRGFLDFSFLCEEEGGKREERRKEGEKGKKSE